MIGKLERVPLRDVWKHEALDFTTWLEENVDVLNELLDFELSSVEREKSAGAFNVDLVAEDGSGNLVVVENQLEKSNHDHLGKILTYLTNLEAKAAIWIVSEPRPEHVRAITWLNESSSASFYLFKAEAVKIGDSPPAPLFTLIVGPSEEGREVGKTKKEMAERYVIRERFWTGLLEHARTRTKLHASISPTPHSYLGTGAGKSGLALNYNVTKHNSQVELYIDRGSDSEAENEAIFDALEASKDEIHETFGDVLDWQRLEGKRACRICKKLNGGYRDDEAEWPKTHAAMVDAMIRLEKALRPHIKKLEI